MTGLYALSWKLPWEPANATAWSFPNTWTATIVSASHWVGFILPGMIDEPGSFSGIFSSANPSAWAAGVPAHVVGDFHQRHRQRAECRAHGHHRVMRGGRRELVRRGDEGLSRLLG